MQHYLIKEKIVTITPFFSVSVLRSIRSKRRYIIHVYAFSLFSEYLTRAILKTEEKNWKQNRSVKLYFNKDHIS